MIRWLRIQLVLTYRCIEGLLDREEVRAFQGMYYVVFSLGAVMLLFVPGVDAAAGIVHLMLGSASYTGWAAINLVCPTITLIGRRLTTKAANTRPGESNSAWGAAWLQLTGDSGVWFGVNIFVYEVLRFNPHWWEQNLFLFLFLIMGVGGGAMFTFRSLRRLIGTKRRVRSQSKSEL